MRRTIALGLLLFGIYAATIGLDAFGESEYAGDEPHYLLAAQSIVDDHDIDVKNQYAARSYERLLPLRAGQARQGDQRLPARAARRRASRC